MRLEEIGFYTLTDARARQVSTQGPLGRACFLITPGCNFSCPYCNGIQGAHEFSFERFQTIITDMRVNHGLRNLRLTGGEPTLHPMVLDMVRLARGLGVERIAMSTNGSADQDFYQQLVDAGVNDFAISCDTDDALLGRELAGVRDNGVWGKVINNIKALAQVTYVNLGITISDRNCGHVREILEFTDALGVADMKLSTSTHWNRPIPGLETIPEDLLDRHPILKYRVNGFRSGRNVRGLRQGIDCHRCPMVMDDMILVGDHHYPCLVYAREKGTPIGTIKGVAEMREERRAWQDGRDTFLDPICQKMCMDLFMDCNNRILELQNSAAGGA